MTLPGLARFLEDCIGRHKAQFSRLKAQGTFNIRVILNSENSLPGNEAAKAIFVSMAGFV